MKKLLLFSCVNLIGIYIGLAQAVFNMEIIPPSPEVASLDKIQFGEVNYYTGTPIINIPIYEITFQDFSLPIGLSYSYNGLKVEENASSVGLGWSLNAGGLIYKTVRGREDDLPLYGYFAVRDTLNIPDPVNESEEYLDFINDLYSDNDAMRYFAEGIYDGIPDDYGINCGSINGSLFLLNNGTWIINPFRQINITHQTSYIPENDYWKVTDESGNLYIFNSDERTNYSSLSTHGTFQEYISAWHLDTVFTNKGDTIVFEYDSYDGFERDPAQTETWYYLKPGESCNPVDPLYNSSQIVQHGIKSIKKIIAKNCTVEFEYFNNRKDAAAITKELNQITIKDRNHDIKKIFILNHIYLGDENDPLKCRLILKEIKISGETLEDPLTYVFNYESLTGALPETDSYSIDHWGYYNGKNNSFLIPKIIPGSIYNEHFTMGGDRNPDFNFAKIGLLKEIVPPTGGTISYFYEPNDYGYVGNQLPMTYQNDNRSISIQNQPPNTWDTISFYCTHQQDAEVSFSVYTEHLPGQDDPFIEIIENPIIQNGEIYGNTLLHFEGNESGITYVDLHADSKYLLYAYVFAYSDRASISVDFAVKETAEKITSGGCRLTKIIQDPDENPSNGNEVIKEYKYVIQGDEDHSSGVIIAEPEYEFNYSLYNIICFSGGFQICAAENECFYIGRTALGIKEFKGSGEYIGYRQIQELLGENGVYGRNIYSYTSAFDFNDFMPPKNSPSISKAYKRGILTNIKQQDAQLLDVTEKIWSYDFDVTDNRNGVVGVYLVEYEKNDPQDYNDIFNPPWVEAVYLEWFPLDSSTYIEYRNGYPIITETKYFYDNPSHAQVSRTYTTTSDNKREYTLTLFPDDYANIEGQPGDQVGMMKERHMINTPIETIQYESDQGGENIKVLNGNIKTYRDFNDHILLNSTYQLETSDPIPKSSFTLSNFQEPGIFPPDQGDPQDFAIGQWDQHYSPNPLVTIDEYDNYSNILQYHKENDINVTILWSYNYTYPVAKIENADYEQVIGILGKSPLNITYEQLQSKNSEELEGIFQILRDHEEMKESLVYSYTYSPLDGMTSETSPNGIKTKYDYDDFGRLSSIRDNDLNILKHIKYNYATGQNQ